MVEYKEYTDYHCYILYFNNRDDKIYRCLHRIRVRVRSLLAIVLGALRLRKSARRHSYSLARLSPEVLGASCPKEVRSKTFLLFGKTLAGSPRRFAPAEATSKSLYSCVGRGSHTIAYDWRKNGWGNWPAFLFYQENKNGRWFAALLKSRAKNAVNIAKVLWLLL